ncbi:MAG TPA: DNA-directed RNA polymerase subunit alpha C-terminal domain-containing protein [Pirellulaceae bacterium]|nr:DNA-directed RNA polymerase subunit alpha C-terminal domain-containing protein [Pirellulaceae bacterium]HMO91691.1 DNA-directed RNA polymerase subunit alpha C-terminal domain-containing protein [Pirellulaceae bacterium]HMP68388.1 DNA-directed RNA polymerase subunit alpha C-terminal domain-containing protein [Pirellulaceae bacterium]
MSYGLPSVDTTLRDIVLSNSSFGPAEIETIVGKITTDFTQFNELRDLANQLESQHERSPATNVRLGVARYLLGNYDSAIEILNNSDSGALAYFYKGKAYFSLNRFEEAIQCFSSANTGGYDNDKCSLSIAECKRHLGQLTEAMTILDNMFGPIEQTAEYLYQRGATIALIGNNPEEVVRLYERAIEADGRHAGALFGLGLENDRRGNDERAIELYQRAAAVFPTNVGVLLNLGILYEDHDQYDRARQCYDRILEHDPLNDRARLFRLDAMASMDGHYDYEDEQRRERLQQVLNIPVAQFELSVRSRNCLQRMGIATLGDLARVTEQELLNSKNFGETSLVEIREMLAQKGLSIGQLTSESSTKEEPVDFSHLSQEEQALFERPIGDLNLSVRARKCMTRLGLTTFGELVRKSGDELLECKNFGVTSLNEIREKLTNFGMKLRGD